MNDNRVSNERQVWRRGKQDAKCQIMLVTLWSWESWSAESDRRFRPNLSYLPLVSQWTTQGLHPHQTALKRSVINKLYPCAQGRAASIHMLRPTKGEHEALWCTVINHKDIFLLSPEPTPIPVNEQSCLVMSGERAGGGGAVATLDWSTCFLVSVSEEVL